MWIETSTSRHAVRTCLIRSAGAKHQFSKSHSCSRAKRAERPMVHSESAPAFGEDSQPDPRSSVHTDHNCKGAKGMVFQTADSRGSADRDFFVAEMQWDEVVGARARRF